MDINRLTEAEVAILLLVGTRTLRNYRKESPPIPIHTAEKSPYFKWNEVLDWYLCRKTASICTNPAKKDPSVVDAKLERALLWRAQREKAEVENAVKRKETVSTEDFAKALEEAIVPARVNLLSIRARLQAVIGEEAAAKTDEEIRRALKSLGGAV